MPSKIAMNIRTIALPTSAEANDKYIATGSVSVFIGVAPASVMVAPNSPTARAQTRRNADIIPYLTTGRRL